jgi:hypothetical protein
VQLVEPAQWSTGVHAGQLSAFPSSSHRPVAQLVHCESVAELHSTNDVQPATGVQGWHWPLPSGQKPGWQAAQCESDALVQVADTAQFGTGVHETHSLIPLSEPR